MSKSRQLYGGCPREACEDDSGKVNRWIFGLILRAQKIELNALLQTLNFKCARSMPDIVETPTESLRCGLLHVIDKVVLIAVWSLHAEYSGKSPVTCVYLLVPPPG